MRNIFLVGIGGFIGSVSRYWLGGYVQGYAKSFPLGTLAVNLIGCFVIGLLAQLSENYGNFSDESRLFLMLGVLGGFTTFSSFGNDTINLFRQGFPLNAILNVGANVMLGLLAVYLGRITINLITAH